MERESAAQRNACGASVTSIGSEWSASTVAREGGGTAQLLGSRSEPPQRTSRREAGWLGLGLGLALSLSLRA